MLISSSAISFNLLSTSALFFSSVARYSSLLSFRTGSTLVKLDIMRSDKDGGEVGSGEGMEDFKASNAAVGSCSDGATVSSEDILV